MSGYSTDAYCRMMTDPNRVDPYLNALAKAVHSDSVVFDIGAGTGLFSIAAAELGAARVYAIEPDVSLEFLREEALGRGVADRIVLVPKLSTEFAPDEKADVIVFDLRGVVPIFPGNIASAQDAARRLLKPGGVMIPRRDVTYAALVEAASEYRGAVDPWLDDDRKPWRACVEANANRTFTASLTPAAVLTSAVPWHVVEYGVSGSDAVAAAFELVVQRAGTAHAVALWFEAELADGIGFSTAPGKCGPIYGQLLLPFESPVLLAEGDRASCTIRIDPAPQNPAESHVWSWAATVTRGDRVLARNEQSMFNRHTINAAALNQPSVTPAKHAADPTELLSGRFAKTEQVLSCEVAGETVLLSLDDGLYFGLNSVGTHIWRAISPAVTVADIRASMLEHFDVDEAICERDLLALIAELADRKLISPQGAAA
jgi:type I protein arginine methyltransferase